ncbi:hypothetical protein G9A89_001266 [Geosiphon pyriformis]|nr:hypothetical protein G9A89_001266 [Geosiphon pyriformis]
MTYFDGIPSQEIDDLELLPSITNNELLDNLQGFSVETPANNPDSPIQENISLQLASDNFFDNTSLLSSQNIENDETLFVKAGSNQGIKQKITDLESNNIELYGFSARTLYCGLILPTQHVIYSSNEIRVMVEKNDVIPEIIISFRGNTPTTNIISDITLTKYPYDQSSKVHQGFFKIFQKNEKALINKVVKMIRKNSDLSLTMAGFDSGGVYAIFTALAIKFQGGSLQTKDIKLYTYGQPRIGDKAFAQLVTKKLIVKRVIYDNDLIPHKPQKAQGYLNFDTEYWVKSLGSGKFQTFQCEGIKDQSGKYLDENPIHLGV